MKTINRFLAVVFMIVSMCFLISCQDQKIPVENTQTPEPTAATVKNFTGVIVGLDEEQKMISLRNAGYADETTIPYTGGTDFLSKYGKALTASQLTLGEVVDVYMDPVSQRLSKVQVSGDIIEYEKQSGIVVNSEEGYLTVNDVNYQYGKETVVLSKDGPIDAMEISTSDLVTFRGVKGQAYSIVVTRGHGYIRPKNNEDFVGGSMIIGGQAILPVTKRMLIPVPEGTYMVSMKNGDFLGKRSVTVKAGQESELDMSLFKAKPSNSGQVDFRITPEGAELYVNGNQVDTSKPVTMQYGKHTIQVRLQGYNDYEGTLTIASANPTVKIDLSKESAKVDSEDASVKSGTSEGTATSKTNYDTDHKITVSEPEKVAVYLDGTYKGVAPCSFTKVIGSHTITLSQEGYTTKSYSVETLDDDEDILWNFPSLVAKK